MKSIHESGPACPIVTGSEVYSLGMSLRDYFAAKALQGLLSNPETKGENGSLQDMLKIAAQVAYMAADAMLAERDRK